MRLMTSDSPKKTICAVNIKNDFGTIWFLSLSLSLFCLAQNISTFSRDEIKENYSNEKSLWNDRLKKVEIV